MRVYFAHVNNVIKIFLEFLTLVLTFTHIFKIVNFPLMVENWKSCSWFISVLWEVFFCGCA